jgi:hypothetical protein
MPAQKRLNDEQIDALMQEFRAQRARVPLFCSEKGIPVPTFRRWYKEWEEKQRDLRLAALPEKPLAWLPPENLSGYKENPPARDGLLTLMVDLTDNLGPHTDQALHITLSCDGLVVSGRLIGAKEYFDAMRETILEGAGELLEKYKVEAQQAFEKLLPDTEQLPERREEWDDFYEPDDRRESPDFVHLANVTIHTLGSSTQVPFWRGRLCAVTSFWMD